MRVDLVTVSRKTPLDGKLEVSQAAANTLRGLAAGFPVAIGEATSPGYVESMRCTCVKEAAGPHVHHFVISDVLRGLTAGATVAVEIDEGSERVVVTHA